MNGRVTTLLTMLAAATVVLSTIGAQPATHYIWNVSESVPIGLYLIQPTGRLFVTEILGTVHHAPTPLSTYRPLYRSRVTCSCVLPERSGRNDRERA